MAVHSTRQNVEHQEAGNADERRNPRRNKRSSHRHVRKGFVEEGSQCSVLLLGTDCGVALIVLVSAARAEKATRRE